MNSNFAGPLYFFERYSIFFESISIALISTLSRLIVSVRAPIPGPISKNLLSFLALIDCPISKIIAGSDK